MNLKKQREVKTVISVIFGVSLAYAIIRYQIFGSVPWRELPLYIINKALSLSALLLLLLALSLKALEKRGWGIAISLLESRATLAKSGFLLLLMHVSISLLLFGSSNYKKFFIEDGSLTLYAGLSMLGGVLAFVILWSIESNKEKRCLFLSYKNFLYLLFFLLAIHLFFMGFDGWINSSKWHGGLPPISLVAFIFLLLAYIVNLSFKE